MSDARSADFDGAARDVDPDASGAAGVEAALGAVHGTSVAITSVSRRAPPNETTRASIVGGVSCGRIATAYALSARCASRP